VVAHVLSRTASLPRPDGKVTGLISNVLCAEARAWTGKRPRTALRCIVMNGRQDERPSQKLGMSGWGPEGGEFLGELTRLVMPVKH
jgi:hypothetical protein